MMSPRSKEEITQAVLKELPRCKWHSAPIGNVVFDWWLTGRGGQGLRLSDVGLKAFSEAKIASWDFPLGLETDKKTKRRKIIAPEAFVSELIKKIKCPYYLGVYRVNGENREPYIKVFDHQTAMMMTIYGTLRDYLDAQEYKYDN